MVTAIHAGGDRSGNSHSRSIEWQLLDAAPDEMELMKATVDHSHDIVPIVDGSDSRIMPKSQSKVEGQIRTPKTLCACQMQIADE